MIQIVFPKAEVDAHSESSASPNNAMIGMWLRIQAVLILTVMPSTIQIDLALSFFYKAGRDPMRAHVRSRLMWSCDNIPPVGFLGPRTRVPSDSFRSCVTVQALGIICKYRMS